MKFFNIKRIMNLFGLHIYDLFSKAPLWAVRPLVNGYYGNCWAELPQNPKVLFIHIPKTAGSSVTTAIYGRTMGHHPAIIYFANDEKRFKETITFSILRNPYDRFCSIFHQHFLSHQLPPWEDYVGKSFFSRYSSPSKLACDIGQKREVRAFYMSLIHARPQVDWIMVEGKVAVQHLFPFEKMELLEDFLRNVLDTPDLCIPHANSSNRSENWESELDSQAIKVVQSLYKEDIRLWEELDRSLHA